MSAATNTGRFIKAGDVSELSGAGKKKINIEGKEIMLAQAGDAYYAVDNRCPHMGGDLSSGKLDDTIITCPRHASQFDISTGQVVRWTNWPGPLRTLSEVVKSPRPIKTYKVKVENGGIYIEV